MGVELGGTSAGTSARTTAPLPPYRPRPASSAPQVRGGGGGRCGSGLPRGLERVLALLWLVVVGVLVARHEIHAAIVMLLVLVVSSKVLRGTPGPSVRRGDRRRQRLVAPLPVPQVSVPRVPAAEQRLSRTLASVEASADRIAPESLDLFRDVGQLLGPLLTGLRTRSVDPRVRHDLETIATEHLPRTLDDYLALPAEYARDHVTGAGTTPAQELHDQLELLVLACRRLRDVVLSGDVDRQQQQTRFLQAKFQRGDLDL